MKIYFIALCSFFISITANSQELSYGPIGGMTFFGVGNNNGTNSFGPTEVSSTNFGAYAEYNFNENIGIKTDITFNKKDIQYTLSVVFGQIEFYKMNFVELSPSFKYDFGQEYRKGFYMLLGPKFAFMTSATTDGINADSNFEKTIVGAQLGFGQRMFKIIDLQTKFNYDLTPFFKLNNGNNSRFFGAYVSLNVDLERIINK